MIYVDNENFPFDDKLKLSILTKNIIGEKISTQIGVLIHLNVKLLTNMNIINEYYLI